jgi:serine/threonine protein kinase
VLQNVLVVTGPPKWWVKLADFGLSKRLTETTAYHTRSGTQSYMALEILDYLDTDVPSTEYTNAVDLWAVGCITYRLVIGKVPFPPDISLMKYCANNSLFPHESLLDNGINSSGHQFIRDLLATHPKERPSASQALNHTWIISGGFGIFSLSYFKVYKLTEVLLGCSNTGKQSEGLSNPNQQTSELSELTVSAIGYNTVSHAGLRSYRPPSSSHMNSSYTEASLPRRSASNTNLSSVSDHSTITRKSFFTLDSGTTAKQLPTAEEASSSMLKSDNLANPSSTKDSQATPQLVPNSTISSPDGKLVASASADQTVRLWGSATGAACRTLEGHSAYVTAVAFSPDGKLIASASADRTVRLWGSTTGAALV